MILIKMIVLMELLSLSQSQKRFMPNLPLGEYLTVFDKIYPCETTKNLSLQFNVFLSKKTSNITELKGNLSFFIPLDDTLTVDMNFSTWGLTGGWIPNSYILNTKNACSNVKKLEGNAWFTIIKGLNIPTDSCPIPVGVYTTSGIELNKLEDHNFPKVYFYGKYKGVVHFKSAGNKLVSCLVAEFNLIRPWEKLV